MLTEEVERMKPSILILDDEECIRYTMKNLLSEKGYEVSMASNLNEAAEKISKKKFDLIFLDIILKGESGLDLLELIKNKKLTTPVIILTAFAELETAIEAVRLQAFDYLKKPMSIKNLFDVAEKALKYKQIIDEKEKYRKNFEAVFRSVRDGIVTVDKDLNITNMNKAAEKLCGFSSELIGNHFASSKKGCRGGKCFKALKETVRTGKPVELYRMECSHDYSTLHIVTVSITPMENEENEFCGAVMVVRDETPIVQMENALRERKKFHNIVGKSKKMKEVYFLMEKLSDVSTTVLITGETGTGKELVAEALHYRGVKKNNSLVKINCSALPENLLESELFGYLKGAFTGAIKNKMGLFQKAHGGTIFLDEIGDISHSLQLRLLRVLQEREFVPVGGVEAIKVNVRIITSTNQDLPKKVRKGVFREDLYYRLHVVEINLPPLRERYDDIPLLIEHFIKKFNKKFNKNIKSISRDVENLFMEYHWPGNIRELEHTIEHSFVVSSGPVIVLDNLPLKLKKCVPTKVLKCQKTIENVQKFRDALIKSGWNKAKAARLLGINRSTIYRKIEKYNISNE